VTNFCLDAVGQVWSSF